MHNEETELTENSHYRCCSRPPCRQYTATRHYRHTPRHQWLRPSTTGILKSLLVRCTALGPCWTWQHPRNAWHQSDLR